MSLTQTRLKALLSYDRSSGNFTWRETRGRVKSGDRAGYVDRHGYLMIRVDKKRYSAHRLAWLYVIGEWPADLIDHKNGIRVDNRFCNLREADVVFNSQNVRTPNRNNSSGYLGVTYNRRAKLYVAHIRHSGKKHCLGYSKDPAEAHALYLDAKRKYHPGNML